MTRNENMSYHKRRAWHSFMSPRCYSLMLVNDITSIFKMRKIRNFSERA